MLPPKLAEVWAGAACKGMDRDLFFPSDDCTPPPVEPCDSCPVRIECFTWGLLHEEHGCWGGLSQAALKTIRKARGIKAEDVGFHK